MKQLKFILIAIITILIGLWDDLIFALLFPIVGFIVMVQMWFGKDQTFYVNGVPKKSAIITKMFGLLFGVFFC